MAERVDRAVATHIGKNVERLTLGENLFHGPPFAFNGLSVFCVSNGGYFPRAINGTADALYRSSVDIRVRGERGKYDEGLVLANLVQAAVQFASLGTDYLMSRVENSSPAYLGQTKDGDPEWVIFLMCTLKE